MPRASLADVCGIGTGSRGSTEIRCDFLVVDRFRRTRPFHVITPLKTGETGRSPFPYRERSSRPVQAAYDQ